MEAITNITPAEAVPEKKDQTPDKSSYLDRIKALPAEDQAFLDGYLFAKVTERRA